MPFRRTAMYPAQLAAPPQLQQAVVSDTSRLSEAVREQEGQKVQGSVM